MRLVLGMFGAMAIGAAAVLWMPTFEDEQRLAVITDISEAGFAKVALPGEDSDAAVAASGNLQTALESPPAFRPAAQDARVTAASFGVGASRQPAGVPDIGGASSAVGHAAVVRDLQRELKRVGCYPGAIDGDWGTQSRSAMRSFAESIRSSLPANEPDYILLTLVQGYSGIACKDAETAARSDQRSVPAPAAASRVQVRSVSTPQQPDWTSATQVLPPSPAQPATPLEGRMSIGAPHDAGGHPQPGDLASGNPVGIAAPPRPRRPAAYAPRRNTSWTADFFNKQY
ncbi:MAG: peptidoglycan-binding protein [Hyphomicrobiaceae bacterium]